MTQLNVAADDTESVPPKPIPVPDPLSQPFWNGAAQGRLVIQNCAGCRRYSHPPVSLCPGCGSEEFRYEAVSGRGRIYSFTITRDARNAAFALIQPYVVAWVELEEQSGLRLICNLPAEDLTRVDIGSEVEVFFEPVSGGQALPQFRLSGD
ncbi:Zn-ribbon domain-containing OB-fold protein [Nocardia nova]|uniref:Zn-ribbon domain-containing OB-fold protein n=1 Tax=Nocardia nova TaxID=37330 RepID=UPI0033C8B92C